MSASSYQQSNIYLQNSIRSRNYDFTPEYSELIGRICAVESAMTLRESASGFCEELMAAFRQIAPYSGVDRICLAMRVGHANELVVVDSWNSTRGGSNVMEPGYRCFVRPMSTLLSLREGEVRIYDDATRIADSFTKNEKPIQRSLSNVMKMGFRSGICIPLHVYGRLAGFFFMNSSSEGIFRGLSDEDYAVLNILSMVSKLALMGENRGDLEYASLASQSFAAFSSRVFDEAEFAEQLQSVFRWMTGERWRPAIQLIGDASFLYSPGSIAYLVARIATTLNPTKALPTDIRVRTEEGDTVQIEIPVVDDSSQLTIELYRTKVKRLERELAFLRVELRAGINHVAIRFPLDPVFQGKEDVFYSV